MNASFLKRLWPGRAKATVYLLAGLTTAACHDAVGPGLGGPAIDIVPVADSVFEGDTIHLVARVYDGAGLEVPSAPVSWSVDDTTVARLVGEDALALLRPGSVRLSARNGTSVADYRLVIGRLVVERVELTPAIITMGRTDHVELTARVSAQGGRRLTDRTVTFGSQDTTVAVVYGSGATGAGGRGLLIGVAPGSATIRASVDGVVGTTQVQVVPTDSTFVMSRYEGSPVPALVESDSVSDGGVVFRYEFYADEGTLVFSGLLQRRYELEVRYSVYRLTGDGTTQEREFIAQVRGQFDRGVVTTQPGGGLSLVSEVIGPLLEHAATPDQDGYGVHYRIPGETTYLDLGFRRVGPS